MNGKHSGAQPDRKQADPKKITGQLANWFLKQNQQAASY